MTTTGTIGACAPRAIFATPKLCALQRAVTAACPLWKHAQYVSSAHDRDRLLDGIGIAFAAMHRECTGTEHQLGQQGMVGKDLRFRHIKDLAG